VTIVVNARNRVCGDPDSDMANLANAQIAQLQAEVLALQEAAAAEAIAAAAAIATAANAATAAAAAALQQAAGAPPPPVFALAPALAATATFLDLAAASGAKHFKGATESLNSQAFDFKDDSDLQVFLNLVRAKSQVWGWNAVFDVPVTDAATATARSWNVISHFGMVPLK
jgi:hypothetical protein